MKTERLTAKHIVETMKDEKDLTTSQKKELKLSHIEDIEEKHNMSIDDMEKVWGILKKHGLAAISFADEFDDFETYADYLEYEGVEPILTKEDFDLIKEMLK